MSRSRKHVTLGLDEDVQPPGPGQSIVRALGSRGSNLIAVEFPDGRQTLVLMPAKFNKKLWVKRGGYLLVEDSPAAGEDTKVTGTILSVLYDDHIKQLAKMPGVWPEEFVLKEEKSSIEKLIPPSHIHHDGDEERQAGPADDDGGVSALPQNSNRKVKD
ncbi:hypothetical protein Vretifemale_6881 [Volvox reticuliferus]|uniref:S1-like domain-containing protein n=1 Tax=Volvox reticuliferus TaxID=1737510 RepID=A0A8J4CE07_9CHLO|nr:hypothetical protein Vretifemale_6881 [Volvox reticuliferus]